MSDHNYTPSSKFGKWFNDRLPLLTLANHLTDYPTPKNLNYWWTFGGILTFCLITQIITGLVLAMHYIAHADLAFSSVEHIMRDVNYGWLIRYIHANGASMFFLAVYIHIFRSLFYGSYKAPREIIWILGIMIYLLMMAAAFMGYVLPWGQMSFWGATVITNLLSPFPCLIEWISGGFYISNPTLKRFFIFHFILPFIICGFIIIHFYYLHYLSSNNSLGYNINNKILFFPFELIKDIFGFLVFITLYTIQFFFGIFSLSHPDNAFIVNELVTPKHIVPEWYFLSYYTMLKALPNKNAGFIILLTSLLSLVLFGDLYSIMKVNNVQNILYRNAERR